jgi:hypothetical protein
MNMRRNFLKGAGIIGAFALGAASYRQVKEIGEANRDITHLAPPKNAYTLQLTGSYGETEVPASPYGPYGIQFHPSPRVTNSVVMSVGKDDRLWMKVGEEWKRVSIEG